MNHQHDLVCLLFPLFFSVFPWLCIWSDSSRQRCCCKDYGPKESGTLTTPGLWVSHDINWEVQRTGSAPWFVRMTFKKQKFHTVTLLQFSNWSDHRVETKVKVLFFAFLICSLEKSLCLCEQRPTVELTFSASQFCSPYCMWDSTILSE